MLKILINLPLQVREVLSPKNPLPQSWLATQEKELFVILRNFPLLHDVHLSIDPSQVKHSSEHNTQTPFNSMNPFKQF